MNSKLKKEQLNELKQSISKVWVDTKKKLHICGELHLAYLRNELLKEVADDYIYILSCKRNYIFLQVFLHLCLYWHFYRNYKIVGKICR